MDRRHAGDTQKFSERVNGWGAHVGIRWSWALIRVLTLAIPASLLPLPHVALIGAIALFSYSLLGKEPRANRGHSRGHCILLRGAGRPKPARDPQRYKTTNQEQ